MAVDNIARGMAAEKSDDKSTAEKSITNEIEVENGVFYLNRFGDFNPTASTILNGKRQKLFISLSGVKEVTVDFGINNEPTTDNEGYYIYFYNAKGIGFEFRRFTTSVAKFTPPSNANSFKAMAFFKGLTIDTIKVTLTGTDKITLIKNVKKDVYTGNDTEMTFPYMVDGEYYNTCKVKLPPNYSPTGKSVPIIYFVHGSGDYRRLDSWHITDSYMDYYNYLIDQGYAIFDCYGWTSKYGYEFTNGENGTKSTNGANTWGLPLNVKAAIAGLKWFGENFNVDLNNVSIMTKSLGGLTAGMMCYQNEIKIKACCMLAPEIDILAHRSLGYDETGFRTIAAETGMTDVETFVSAGCTKETTAGYKYLQTHAEKLNGSCPTWKNLIGCPMETKIKNSLDKTTDETLYKTCDIPTKIWVAQDDDTVSYNNCKAYVQQLLNGGCNAELRTMPNNTGKHHAVDNDENALKEASVTTRLGIVHENVPTAYVEAEEYIKKYMFK